MSDPVDERLDGLRRRLGGLAYGGDYNPEQWDRETWKEDVRLMREAGVNLVTVGVFSWGLLEPSPGVFDFGWLDQIMDLLAGNGINVDLATPTAAPPSWLAHRHPGTLPIDPEGRRTGFGARCHYCQSSPVFREYAARITEKLAQRYAGHPALAMWHIGNEYIGYQCHCEASVAHFQRWLADRYESIEALNDAWGTAFWGQHYETFDHIGAPAPRSRLISGPNPGQVLDYWRFSDAAALECFTAERDIVRRHTPDLPILTNFMGSFKNLDYWKWAAAEDIAAIDIYAGPLAPDGEVKAAYNFDLMRSLRGGKPWLMLESATGRNLSGGRNPARPAGQIRARSLQAVARGADSVMFFQWRASRAGAERFHSAMVPHGGTGTRTWREVVALGEDVGRLANLAGGRCDRAEVAMVWDWESWWALEGFDHPSSDLRWTERVMEHYRPLWGANVPVDFVKPTDDLSEYRLVVVPNLYLTDEAGTANLTDYVREGGHLLMSYFSGIVDEFDRVLPGAHPGAFRELLGIEIDEFGPLPEGRTSGIDHDGHIGRVVDWQDHIVLDGAQALAVITDGELRGRPAVTRNGFGSGTATYIGVSTDRETMRRMVLDCVSDAGAKPLMDTRDGVEVVRRRDKDGRGHLFVLNHNAEAVEIDLKQDGRLNLLEGQGTAAGRFFRLSGYGVAVLSEETEQR
ncbi:beta-galactosidase [Glycomyces buryatensis]|uniref:Beta-galactosidase n=1 Tax=Glycomyces buryatensis TaxID=2570927 RepID=A0A4S8QMX2_9ACTN|nr:beta-galactosidase [Glycomyces buryatensis]THV42789.1 beta-galactosidase [Glycomyces buryatensis]